MYIASAFPSNKCPLNIVLIFHLMKTIFHWKFHQIKNNNFSQIFCTKLGVIVFGNFGKTAVQFFPKLAYFNPTFDLL